MKKVLFPFLFLLLFSSGFSQNYLGVSSSNYAGVMGNDLNPASFVDGRFKFDLNLFSTNLNVYQNFGYLDTKYMRDAQNNLFGTGGTIGVGFCFLLKAIFTGHSGLPK